MTRFPASFQSCFEKQFLFVQGKGGVGKSTVAEAVARTLARSHRTLLVSIEDPLRKPGDVRSLEPMLDHLNNEATSAFEEYAGLKIGAPKLVRIFLQNHLMRYLAKAAPGVRELVLMGKIWYERRHYGRIVIDMPATGHGLTMFQSLFNWGSLFEGSPIAKDARAVIEGISDPTQTSQMIVSIAEEMPLIESLELRAHLIRIFPKSDVALVANRLFPAPRDSVKISDSEKPFAETAREHAERKFLMEQQNLEIWKGEEFTRVPYFAPPLEGAFTSAVAKLTETFKAEIKPHPAQEAFV